MYLIENYFLFFQVTTLTMPVFHRNGGSTSNAKKHIAPSSDINANNTSITNENFVSTLEAEGHRGHGGRNGSNEGHIRRVPELCNPVVIESRDHHMTASNQQHNGEHDLKKWSELCKMQTTNSNIPNNGTFPQNKRPESTSTGTSSNHGDSNNNLNSNSGNSESGTSTVLPDMDFSN